MSELRSLQAAGVGLYGTRSSRLTRSAHEWLPLTSCRSGCCCRGAACADLIKNKNAKVTTARRQIDRIFTIFLIPARALSGKLSVHVCRTESFRHPQNSSSRVGCILLAQQSDDKKPILNTTIVSATDCTLL